MRSLLFQLLRNPCTEAYARKAFGMVDSLHFSWTQIRLDAALKRCLGHCSGAGVQILLLTDGLDECTGQSEDLLKLLESLTAHFRNLKMCLSSRPEQAFRNEFSERPKLRLEDLNYGDIQKMIETDFLENPRVLRSLSAHSEDLSTNLRWTLQLKAQGVMLWLKLAINALIRGLRNLDTAEILVARLSELPVGMNNLYSLMLSRNNADEAYYGEMADRYLQLILTGSDIWLTDFCLAINDELRAELLHGDLDRWQPARL